MKTVVVVDDDPLNLTFVSSVLKRQDFRVITVQESTEALTVILTEKPDLIITDIIMPQFDGWDLVRMVRSWPETAMVPVIFLTQLDDAEDRMQGFQLGADDYLAKPVRPTALKESIEKVFSHTHELNKKYVERLMNGDTVEGFLNAVGLPSLLGLIDQCNLDGVLTVINQEETVNMQVCNGRVMEAAMDGARNLTGADCIQDVLNWRKGAFRFEPAEVTHTDYVGEDTSTIFKRNAVERMPVQAAS